MNTKLLTAETELKYHYIVTIISEGKLYVYNVDDPERFIIDYELQLDQYHVLTI